MKKHTTQELYDFIGRVDTLEKAKIAVAFIEKQEYLTIDDYDGLMMAATYTLREMYRMEH